MRLCIRCCSQVQSFLCKFFDTVSLKHVLILVHQTILPVQRLPVLSGSTLRTVALHAQKHL